MTSLATMYQSLGKFRLTGMLLLLLASPLTLQANPAGEPPVFETATINASVLPYAAVTASDPHLHPLHLGDFSGVPNEGKPTRHKSFFVETNVTLDLNYSFSLLKNDSYSLDTRIAVQKYSNGHVLTNEGFKYVGIDVPPEAYYEKSVTAIAGQAAKTTESYTLIYKVSTGPSISSQPAGDYSGAVTLTVSAYQP